MFNVYDNGKPASTAGQKVLTPGNGWDNHSFHTFEKAVEYAKLYLGEYDCLPANWDGLSYDYSGYGDTIEIRHSNKPER